MMDEPETLLSLPFEHLARDHPLAKDFIVEARIRHPAANQSLNDVIESMDQFELSDCGMSAKDIKEYFAAYLVRMEGISKLRRKHVTSITLKGGVDKTGGPEYLDLTVRAGEVVCIVGPTGSGKSRLLEDIECLAQGDTPTRRQILVNGEASNMESRLAVENRIVAELSQSMVFVMDLAVRDFLHLHAESRLMPERHIDEMVKRAIHCANNLAGESFDATTKLTALSGGQSRALMIADLAFISTSPIVLIDEIENAGVDRRRALELLIRNDKIVFVVTHDPLIALMGDRRLAIRNGGVSQIVTPSPMERKNMASLCDIDEKIMRLRRLVRDGEPIDFDVSSFLASDVSEDKDQKIGEDR